MKRVLLCYNPVSGKGNFRYQLDYVVDKFQKKGFTVTFYRLSLDEEFSDYINRFKSFDYDIVVAAGGDGTINTVVNGMISNNIDVPLGIMPVGTSNDFAGSLKIIGGIDRYIQRIVDGEHKLIDIGSINDKYFVNVVSIGKLASIAHKTNHVIKNNLGKLGYYINVLNQTPVLEYFKIKVLIDNKMYEEDAVLVFILNSKGAGGFKNLAPNAVVDDGKFDVLIIKNCNLIDKLNLFLKIVRGEHHTDDCVHYFQADKIYISCKDYVETDVDGEVGPELPMIIAFNKKIKLLY